MYKEARQVMGRYEKMGGGAVNIAVTRVYGGFEPFEIIFMRFDDNKDYRPNVIHRVVVDFVEEKVYQGQNKGLHGEGSFTERRIKDMTLTRKARDFVSASGSAHLNFEFKIQEYR